MYIVHVVVYIVHVVVCIVHAVKFFWSARAFSVRIWIEIMGPVEFACPVYCNIAGAGCGYLPLRAAPAAEPGAGAENASRLHLGKDPLRRRRECLATIMS